MCDIFNVDNGEETTLLQWLRHLTDKKKTEPDASSPKKEPEKKKSAAPRSDFPPKTRVIERPDHTISRRDINTNALKVMGRLIRAGHKGYLVGGSIRDLLIGRRPKDFDVVTDASPNQVRRLFRNSRLIGRRFRLVHVFFHGGEIIEVSTFRKGVPFDSDDDDQRPDENTFGTPAEDAIRRDLTINGLFYNLDTFQIYDHVGGMEDIENRIVRVIGDVPTRFVEDPIRMLRAIRHAAGTGFEIEPVTREAIANQAAEILDANPSRLRDEFMRELTEGRSARSIELMLDLGMLQHLLPVSRQIYGDDQAGLAARAHLLGNLHALDEAIIKAGHRIQLPLPTILAAFTSPLVKAQDYPSRVADPRRLRGYLPVAIREFLKPVIQGLGISKGHAEATAMMLVGLHNIEQALAQGGNLSRTLTRKAYFPPALLLYQIETRGRNERLPQSVFNSAQEKELLLYAVPGRSGNRRRKRRPRSDDPSAGASDANATPEKTKPVDASFVFDASPPAGPKTPESK